ncbi:hypothetical protein ONS96_000762 [Cadophora gregata f. sp. sojae]|nr:hypothetical protein ONS96_000762 [Cadophora gregata f. sp. sojae]
MGVAVELMETRFAEAFPTATAAPVVASAAVGLLIAEVGVSRGTVTSAVKQRTEPAASQTQAHIAGCGLKEAVVAHLGIVVEQRPIAVTAASLDHVAGELRAQRRESQSKGKTPVKYPHNAD